MIDVNLEENIIYSELQEDALSLHIAAKNNNPVIKKTFDINDDANIKFSFQLKDILQSIKSGYELDGEENKLDFSVHYPLIKAYKKEIENELRKIDELEYIIL